MVSHFILRILVFAFAFSHASAHAGTIVHQNLNLRPGDKPFLEFRSRKPNNLFDNGHVFVLVGVEREGSIRYGHSFGFYPTSQNKGVVDDVKRMFYGPGEVAFDVDKPLANDETYRVYVTPGQARRVIFAAKQIRTEGKTYSFPMQTCVDFAKDLAKAADLDVGPSEPPMPRDPLLLFDPYDVGVLRPIGLVEDLRKKNTPLAPIVHEVERLAAREPEMARRLEKYNKLLASTPTGPPVNSVAQARMEEGSLKANPKMSRGRGGYEDPGEDGPGGLHGRQEELFEILMPANDLYFITPIVP